MSLVAAGPQDAVGGSPSYAGGEDAPLLSSCSQQREQTQQTAREAKAPQSTAGGSVSTDILGSKHSARLFRKLCRHSERSMQGWDSTSLSLDGPTPLELFVTSDTLLYRHLAMTRVEEHDRAVEIGTSYGHCTALFRCPGALGVDHAPEKVLQAQNTFPHCRFVCGNVFGADLTWLDQDATVLFLDIGGGVDYKPVMKALAICISHMPALRLVVAKSIEVRGFLQRFEDSIDTVARDLTVTKDDDAEAAEELAVDIRRRGGEVPVSLIHLLRCGPRLRYLVGKHRMLAFVKHQAPVLELTEVSTGPADRRVRVKAAPGDIPPVPAYALCAVQAELKKRLHRLLQDGEEHSFLAVFQRLQRGFYRKYIGLAADPQLHRQASDPSLDDRDVEPWSDVWLNAVAMRHVHAFLVATPEFELVGDVLEEVATNKEICKLKVKWTGEPAEVAANSVQHSSTVSPNGQRVVLQVLDCNWSAKEDVPKVQDLLVEKAWLLVDGQVVEELTHSKEPQGHAQ